MHCLLLPSPSLLGLVDLSFRRVRGRLSLQDNTAILHWLHLSRSCETERRHISDRPICHPAPSGAWDIVGDFGTFSGAALWQLNVPVRCARRLVHLLERRVQSHFAISSSEPEKDLSKYAYLQPAEVQYGTAFRSLGRGGNVSTAALEISKSECWGLEHTCKHMPEMNPLQVDLSWCDCWGGDWCWFVWRQTFKERH